MATRPPKANTEPVVEAQLEDLIEEELLEWYLMTPAERWDESQRLWATFTLLGGSLAPEPDSESPFDVQGEPGRGAADGGAGLHSVRRSGV
jgi:hypothetical protein